MIKLEELISLAGINLTDFKIHCAVATGQPPTPLEAYYDGTFKEWQENQNRNNFPCSQVLSLIQLSDDHWLFAGLFSVHNVEPVQDENYKWFRYSTSEVPGLDHLVGRVVVDFKKKFRQSYLKGPLYKDRLLVGEVRRTRQTIADFPSYQSVCISLRLLRTILRQDIPSWRTALRNVAGVYLVTDRANGKAYVGSAYGDQGLWQRWSAYADCGHGGNKELIDLLVDKGADYAHNFQFTILEVIDLNASQEHVFSRECHWKDVLLTRQFGYNSN
jgi:hypothetical protein